MTSLHRNSETMTEGGVSAISWIAASCMIRLTSRSQHETETRFMKRLITSLTTTTKACECCRSSCRRQSRSNIQHRLTNVRIDNPFLHWSPSTVERKTRLFAKQHALQVHEHVLVKAARILQDPEAWQGVPNLTAEEKHALDGEKRGTFWKQHKGLRVTVIMLCFAAVVQGWNQTGSNGAVSHSPFYHSTRK